MRGPWVDLHLDLPRRRCYVLGIKVLEPPDVSGVLTIRAYHPKFYPAPQVLAVFGLTELVSGLVSLPVFMPRGIPLSPQGTVSKRVRVEARYRSNGDSQWAASPKVSLLIGHNVGTRNWRIEEMKSAG